MKQKYQIQIEAVSDIRENAEHFHLECEKLPVENHWPEYRITGTWDALVNFMEIVYDETEEFLKEFATAIE